jgi:hypothetical protein
VGWKGVNQPLLSPSLPLPLLLPFALAVALLYPTQEPSFRPKLLTLYVSSAVEKSASLPPAIGLRSYHLALLPSTAVPSINGNASKINPSN